MVAPDPELNSGMDTKLGDACSRTAFGWARRTFENRAGRLGMPIFKAEGGFANLMDFGGLRLAMTSDGVGTKVELAERLGVYDTLGHDLVAMTCDDLAAAGVEPVNLSNILDVDHLDQAVVDSLMRGLHAAAGVAGIAVVGGEIAELGDRIGGWGAGMHFNWCATAVGVLPTGQAPLDGSGVAAGQAVVALRSHGLRSNGFSLARRVLAQAHGPDWHLVPCGDGRSWGEALLTPSLIYSPLIAALRREDFPLTGVAHITGGGVSDNLARVLALRGLGARLDHLFPPQPFVLALQAVGEVPEHQAYQLWNMGNGMLITLPREEASAVCARAGALGYEARIAGEVTAESAFVFQSRGCEPCRLIRW